MPQSREELADVLVGGGAGRGRASYLAEVVSLEICYNSCPCWEQAAQQVTVKACPMA